MDGSLERKQKPSLPLPAYTRALEQELRAAIEGEVRFDPGSRALYATDGSNYRQPPIGVVIPKSIEDVIETVAACRKYDAPLLSRGGGTSLAGQCCNHAVVMDFSKYLHGILELDPEGKFARVQPGTILDHLRTKAEEHTLTFAPDPSTHTHNTLGGMIGNNSCGVHSVMGGKTSENVEELEILTYDGCRMTVGATSDDELQGIINAGGRRGEIYKALRELRDRYASLIRARYPKIPRRVSGYNLDELLPENGFHVARALVGSEGTCVTILEAKLRLVYSPPFRSLLVLGYQDVFEAGDHVCEILEAGPVGLEGMDDKLIQDMKTIGLHPQDLELVPQGQGWLLAEFGGDSKEEADEKARKLMGNLRGKDNAPLSMKLFDDKQQEKELWTVRRGGLGATAHVPNKRITWEGWEDAAVPPEKLGDYLRDFRALLKRYRYEGDLYGHFGQGCVHTRIDFDLESQPGIDKFHAFLSDAADLVVGYGGSLSGEHGDGQSKAEFLTKMFGEELVRAFGEFKRIWDPRCRMNPGKLVDPYLPTENLRIGAHYAPPNVPTHFRFPKDDHDFARTVLRCVGVGDCRRTEHGAMCPSFMASREERWSTRGRARLLFEMLKGEVITGGWKDEHVFEALDYCLACKGCKGQCPVKVDMASYKAEFLSHYYKGRLRPRTAYSMGLIHRWARVASRMPRFANSLAQSRTFSPLLKKLGGIARERSMPRFAQQTLRDWFAQRGVRNGRGCRVLLWPDTFTNFFLPETGMAAVEVLERAGCTVVLPEKQMCCGRPLYDFGMLDRAIALWRETLEVLREDIRAGTPLVGLEPACVAAFRDELHNLFPHDEDAKRLGEQTFTLAEYLQSIGYAPHRMRGKAIVHVHCNQVAVMGHEADRQILEQTGLQVEVLDSGCCGMAGSFGFEQQKYAMSQTIGERVLLPRVREADALTLVIADGFSCREQIRQGTQRETLHLAQVLQLALHEGAAPPANAQPPKPARRKNIGAHA
ncbi:MAG: FAD-linked oxidase C-terminal domain-containing protein [Rhodanobacteraceae bacterium]